MQKRMEIAVAGTLLLLAVVFALFIDAFVAKPKTLFGRSLSAIEPTAFPLITMAMMIVLCGLFFYAMFRRSGQAQMAVDDGLNRQTNWIRIGAFFVVLVLYALTFDPLGFLTSTFIAMVLLSLLAGNRNIIQIAIFSAILPLAFYLLATRVLLVSLPEQSGIEFLIARILGG
ncbi:tripartite tricarboxylate transporter TctB family protein [Nitratireductor sp. XY-223]|uniref:tripartite tricarboxylate transporter TctB family protein n=1 Tax=Nitratireductor sp. XY-223 TaxID=2561926 RepID=UPI00145BD360|nr:tripartite tricarboxylate transporter TctB family protein [Nitratireductor sp. XY-223]